MTNDTPLHAVRQALDALRAGSVVHTLETGDLGVDLRDLRGRLGTALRTADVAAHAS